MQTSRKKIFILGSGLVSEPAIDYLLCREENFILVGSNCEKELSSLKEKKLKKNPDYEKRIEFFVIDAIKDKVLLNKTVSECDIVISLIPEVLQVYIAKCCVENNKNLVTTSNITKDIQKFAKKALEKNLVFMFEAGVNPGLDHIIAFKVLQEQSELGNIIVGYESWVGAIPSPECLDNPLLYKFSWSPKDALLSLTHNAKQLINGKVVNINEKVLLTHHLVDKKFHPSLNFEGYYNGDSLMYKDLYNLQHAKNVIRGIFRYQGFSFVIQCFKFLNLFSFERIDPKFQTWREYINKTLKNPRIQDSIYEVKNKYLKKGLEMFVVNPKLSDSISERMFYFNLCLLALSYFDDKYIRKYGFETLFNRIYSVFIFLEFYKEDNKFIVRDSVIDALSKLLETKISIGQMERDLIFMQNEFQIQKKNGAIFKKKYDLLVFGGHCGLPYTATSLLVGKPAAIITQLILDNKVSERGLIIPKNKEIIDSVLEQLKQIQIVFHESTEMKARF